MTRNERIDDDAAQYENIMRRLQRLEQGIPEDVHVVGAAGEPAFQSGWVHYDSGSGTPDTGRNVGFYRDRGRVFLQGVMSGGTPSVLVFTLPEEYWPMNGGGFPGQTSTGTAEIYVNNIGRVVAFDRAGSDVNNWVYLDAISFRHA
jgi:hypothetical protein